MATAKTTDAKQSNLMAGRSRLGTAVRKLPPGAFAFVMATGIVGAAFSLVGQGAITVALLVIAVVSLVALLIALVWRVARHWDLVYADARNPAIAFGFATIVAALNVVGALFFSIEPAVTIVLLCISVPFWLVLTYGIAAAMMLGPQDGAPALKANGSWFIWVVATQSISVVTGIIDHGLEVNILGVVAVGMWSIGVVLYIVLTVIITLRLMTTTQDAFGIRPTYWVYMGATAITVYSGWSILSLLADLPIIKATHDFVSGFTFMLWAFGVWWIPLLVIFGLWRHAVKRYPVQYESELWSMVFPLGMFSVASIHLGRLLGLPIVHDLGIICTWIAGVMWVAVTALMLKSAARRDVLGATTTERIAQHR
ncbi:tellurite resistance protein TehA-like permease [Cryobacterium mesophilum]|uniref:Tellurite resistance protein permease n=1 Tax=Terrimesophilobacter mesophilus TaxID=433647 RepID=A0A4V3I9N9_9MICO|nr:tellurite resistance/C4-dicarboxylate transporter family protein [Terrimesophilobacter mesophilus]MBB5633522.1 tellurite resistance protein TehA-like permease [Terrimesophilobacter mesophilus]TFB80228.1 tellurite resistance protein permease [Terrimesophilobacter mesophilus]